MYSLIWTGFRVSDGPMGLLLGNESINLNENVLLSPIALRDFNVWNVLSRFGCGYAIGTTRWKVYAQIYIFYYFHPYFCSLHSQESF